MTPFAEQNPGAGAQPTETAAFCQQCGRPLAEHDKRVVGQSVYCEPCLQAKLGASAAPGYRPVATGAAMGAWGMPVTPATPATPNPVLALLLGFIPGVGAMYNGQYAKGVVHLIVFAVLVSLADANGIFGLFVAGWIGYMAIEATQTARARLDGTPLPNPFGLNDIGERLGFGRNWAGGPAGPAAGAASANPAPPPAAAAWGAPAESYPPPPSEGPTPYQPVAGAPSSSYAAPGPATTPWPTPEAFPGNPYQAPFPVPPPVNRFPAGAVWLIGLGVLFLLSTTGFFHAFAAETVLGLALIAGGVWLFVRRMTETGAGLADDGSSLYTLRLCRALRGGVWLVLVGLLVLLNQYRLFPWHRSWPLFLIVAGVLALLDRTLCTARVASYGVPYPPPATPPVPGPGVSSAVPPSADPIRPATDASGSSYEKEGL